VDWYGVFWVFAEKYHWTPEQVLDLTMGQFQAFMKRFAREHAKADDGYVEPDYAAIRKHGRERKIVNTRKQRNA